MNAAHVGRLRLWVAQLRSLLPATKPLLLVLVSLSCIAGLVQLYGHHSWPLSVSTVHDALSGGAGKAVGGGGGGGGSSSSSSNGRGHGGDNSRPLITYAYSESDNARYNLEFFLSQGLHGAADFVFILNGDAAAARKLIPTDKPNVRVVERPNTCYDLGAHGEVLRRDGLWKRYSRFVLLNASVRGPFRPYWAATCWSDVFLDRVTDRVKLVGMTANCQPVHHIQSMVWATDAVGLEALLFPPPGLGDKDWYGPAEWDVALQGCAADMDQARHAEIQTTVMMNKLGYGVDVLMAAFHKDRDFDYDEACRRYNLKDILWDKHYYGANVHPYETIFFKANRDIDPVLIDNLSRWHFEGNVTTNGSWDVCK